MYSKGKVLVAMSGGVDSSVAALLLRDMGYAVKGVFMALLPPRMDHTLSAEKDHVISVAKTLGIDLEILDLREAFKTEVEARYLSQLRAGLTPNPCVVCNKKIKWGYLLDHARDSGFDLLASGHYARLGIAPEGGISLLKGQDNTKDQSYMLSTLTQDQLRSILLPLGGLSKEKVRQIASENGLSDQVLGESQDLCFLEGLSQEEFFKKNIPEMLIPGDIKDLSGNILGRHKGLVLYTEGQRKGIGLAKAQPLYVYSKNNRKNELIVAYKDELKKTSLVAREVNWISGSAPDLNREYEVKIRYKARPIKGKIELKPDNEIVIKFEHSLVDITPGQRAVIYDGERCLGGGEISTALD